MSELVKKVFLFSEGFISLRTVIILMLPILAGLR